MMSQPEITILKYLYLSFHSFYLHVIFLKSLLSHRLFLHVTLIFLSSVSMESVPFPLEAGIILCLL